MVDDKITLSINAEELLRELEEIEAVADEIESKVEQVEVKSLEWLSKYYNQKDEIYLDRYAILKAYSFPRINEKNVLGYILPSIIDKKELRGNSSHVK